MLLINTQGKVLHWKLVSADSWWRIKLLEVRIFFVFLGPHPLHMEDPGLGVKLELLPLTYTIATATQGLSHTVTYITAHGNAGSLTHSARPGIEPISLWILIGFVTTEPWWVSRIFYFYWNRVDLQCFFSFNYTIKWFSYIYICMYVCVYIYILFYVLFHYTQDNEYSSLCYTAGPCWLSILSVPVCVI